mgnify:FL=1|jgi:hypothetical protein|tara:strand:+ start:296 stop:526 length:231 start_codon:yes stop_codon:yes gene_type:complete
MEHPPKLVRPIQIASPFTGTPVRPKIKSLDYGDRIQEEAFWFCPDSGNFIQKGVVSVVYKGSRGDDGQETGITSSP